MKRALLGGLTSLTVTCATAPLLRKHLIRQGFLDIPNHRSSHVEPTPRGGGIACLAGVACGTFVAKPSVRALNGIALGIGTLALVGFVDDRTGHLSPTKRLAAQTVAGTLLNRNGIHNLPAAALFTPGVVNVVNFMDGINGITGATATVWGASALIEGNQANDQTLQILGAVTAGAGLGFLPWNVPKAQLFLGDVGSYLFGGLMAAAIANAFNQPALAWRIASPLLPYFTDAATTLLQRAQKGAPLTQAHRDHSYQRLVDELSLSHILVALIHASAAGGAAHSARRGSPAMQILAPIAISVAYTNLPTALTRLLSNRLGNNA